MNSTNSSKEIEIELEINKNCIRKVPLYMYPKDFTFIYKDHKIKTSRIVADLLSPKICRLHYSDGTISQYEIEIERRTNTEGKGRKNQESCENFEAFKELIKNVEKGEKIKIGNSNKNKLKFLKEIFKEFENEELFKAQNIFVDDEITIENVIERISLKEEFYPKNLKNELIEGEIEFISKHFYEMLEKEEKKEEIKKLKTNIIEKIISIKNENLIIKHEDTLISFLNELYKKEQSNSYMYENVIFDNLSMEKLKEFLDIFNINDLNDTIWTRIKRRLIKQNGSENNKNCLEESNQKRYKDFDDNVKWKNFEYTPGTIFNGILRNLSIDPSSVEITSSGSDGPRNLIGYGNTGFYLYKSYRDPWVCFDFKDNLVHLTHYQIKSGSGEDRETANHDWADYPKNWVIETSIDGSENSWIELDRQKNCSFLCKNKVIVTFLIKKETQIYRYVRFRHNGPSSNKYIHSYFSQIEFYGNLKRVN